MRDSVVLLHGFAANRLLMLRLAGRLRAAGFQPRLLGQRNLDRSLEELVDDLDRQLGERPGRFFVGHSLGGVVMRAWLARRGTERSRLVQLGSPNQGSMTAQRFHDAGGFPWGPFDPFGKLLPGDRGQCAGAPIPDAEVGIIAGVPRRPVGVSLFAGKPGERHDGTVAAAETHLPGAERLELPVSHSFLPNHPEVARQTAHFLRHGRFDGSARREAHGSAVSPERS